MNLCPRIHRVCLQSAEREAACAKEINTEPTNNLNLNRQINSRHRLHAKS